jgi:hypothetical protein
VIGKERISEKSMTLDSKLSPQEKLCNVDLRINIKAPVNKNFPSISVDIICMVIVQKRVEKWRYTKPNVYIFLNLSELT